MKLTPRSQLSSCIRRRRRCSDFLKRLFASAERQKCFTWPTPSSRERWKWRRICLQELKSEGKTLPLISQMNADEECCRELTRNTRILSHVLIRVPSRNSRLPLFSSLAAFVSFAVRSLATC